MHLQVRQCSAKLACDMMMSVVGALTEQILLLVFFELRRVLDGLFVKAVDVKTVLKTEKERWDRSMAELNIADTYPLLCKRGGMCGSKLMLSRFVSGITVEAFISVLRSVCLLEVAVLGLH
eukprot:6376932-Amphidinium_carterae.2